jgi:hypothetical protein
MLLSEGFAVRFSHDDDRMQIKRLPSVRRIGNHGWLSEMQTGIHSSL